MPPVPLLAGQANMRDGLCFLYDFSYKYPVIRWLPFALFGAGWKPLLYDILYFCDLMITHPVTKRNSPIQKKKKIVELHKGKEKRWVILPV